MKTLDVSIELHGTIVLIRPLTPQASEWIEENVFIEDWQRFGGAVACEPRYVEPLAIGLHEQGFTFAVAH
jgi:hypothetical protein